MLEAAGDGGFELGCSVQVSGLQSAAGKELNGRRGVITQWVAESGRLEVRFSKNRVATVKACNLTKVPSLPSDSVLREGIEGLDPDARSPCVFQDLPFHDGDFVETFGLHSETGKELNGKNGCILKYLEESGRFEVRFALGLIKNQWQYKIVQLKPDQLKLVSKNPCAKKKLPASNRQQQQRPVFNRTNVGVQPGGFGGPARYQDESEPPPYSPPPMDFFPGDEVEVFGLQSESGKLLNGRTGSIWAYAEEKGRWEVKFTPDEDLRSLRRENLRKLPGREQGSYV